MAANQSPTCERFRLACLCVKPITHVLLWVRVDRSFFASCAGQHFLTHEDAFPFEVATAKGYQRRATLLVYLNDCPEGESRETEHGVCRAVQELSST